MEKMFVSTRNRYRAADEFEVVLKGTAEDGGLFVPGYFPAVNFRDCLNTGYTETAAAVLKGYFPNITANELKAIVENAYSSKRFGEEVIKVQSFEGYSFLELYHGPTMAFKDFGLSFLPHMLELAADIKKVEHRMLILTATSGDTGSSALEGFRNSLVGDVLVFYPAEGISDFQKLQMLEKRRAGCRAVAIDGNFDDAQRAVKEFFRSDEVKTLEKAGYLTGSANSINIGRLLPQIVYYYAAYNRLIERGVIAEGEEIDVTVPSGNFGNAMASVYAGRMGLPVNTVYIASNSNTVLKDYFTDGIYNSNRDLKITPAPSMDILVSSNLERYFHLNCGRGAEYISSLMEEFSVQGEVTPDIDRRFVRGSSCTDREIIEGIGELWSEEEYLIDPHTSAAWCTFKKNRENRKRHNLLVSTASPFKFPATVLDAIGIRQGSSVMENIDILSRKTSLDLPSSVKPDADTDEELVVSREQIPQLIKEFAEKGVLR